MRFQFERWVRTQQQAERGGAVALLARARARAEGVHRRGGQC